MFPAVLKLRVSRGVADAFHEMERALTASVDGEKRAEASAAIHDKVVAAGLAATGVETKSAPAKKRKTKGK